MKPLFDYGPITIYTDSVSGICIDIHDKKVGDDTPLGLIVKKTEQTIQFLDQGTVETDSFMFPTLKGKIGEEYWEGDRLKGVVIRSKDKDGRFLMSYKSYGWWNRPEPICNYLDEYDYEFTDNLMCG